MRQIKMMIDDYELMAHARRAFLDWANRSGSEGLELSAEHRKAAKSLAGDARLDGAVFMTWDSTPEGDLGWVAALRWLGARVGDDLATAHIPEAERPGYVIARAEAIARTLAKLDGSQLAAPG